MPPPPSIDSWYTHGNDVVHICAEIWRQSKIFREWYVATDRDFIYCIHSEKTVMSAKSVVGIFNYTPTTLSDRRKANPGFTNSVFKL